MNAHFAALRESITAEIAADYQDFTFHFTGNPDGNLTIEYRGTWEQPPEPGDTPLFTIEHAADCFLVSRYQWSDRKKYKTLKGTAKYIIAELHGVCDRARKRKAEDDAKREFAENSVRMLRDMHDRFSRHGLNSKLCLKTDRHNYDHVSVEAERINIRIDIVITHDYRLELVPAYSRFYATPETAVDILSVLSKEEKSA